jgi:colanic acid biosynthesis glycosyl transferase WcaI
MDRGGGRPRLRVCLITEYFYPEDGGGTPAMLSELVRFLADQHPDLAVDVITSRNFYRSSGARPAPLENWDGVLIRRLSVPRSNRPSTALRLLAGLGFAAAATARLLLSHRYDLVLVGTNPPAAPAAAAALKWVRKTPYAYLVHDLYPDIAVGLGALRADGAVARFARWWQRRWLHGAARVTALGRCMRNHLVTSYGLGEHRIEVVPNWTDVDAILPKPRQESGFRKRHGLRGFVVLYAGNIGDSQRLEDILGAAALLRDSHPQVSFVLAGDGNARDRIASQVAGRNLRNVVLLAPVPPQDYPDLLAAADASFVSLSPALDGLAVPSKFGNLLAAARPVIAVVPDASELSHVISEAECGVQVTPGEPQQLAFAVARLAEAEGLCHRMGANARRAAASRFTLRGSADQYYQLITSLARVPAGAEGRSGRPPSRHVSPGTQ